MAGEWPHPLHPGTPAPLGARWDGRGVNVAVFSQHAERIDVCLFDPQDGSEVARSLPARSGDVWHGYLEGAGPGLIYGLRAHGPYRPRDGHRFNPHKLLIDPYARELCGRFAWDPAVHGGGPRDMDTRDSAAFVPRCRVPAPVMRGRRPPRPCVPWSHTVLYEMHVRGFSMRHPDVPPALRGTFEALGEPVLIDHLRRLGVTAVELLPVAAFLDERHLVRRGLRDYWGYNPLAFLAMHPAYLGPDGMAGVMRSIDRLHAAGIEVILDVVYNHTAEGNARGPTLAMRGLDNAAYYRLQPDDPAHYADVTGCGNTLDLSQPAAVDLVLAALRHWALDVGVDGFRFDLAAALARNGEGAFDPAAPLLQALRNDPDLAALKLIAEPWDLGPDGYATGRFPAPFREWNDHYRDDVRRYWRGDAGMRGVMARCLAGSSEVFAGSGRPPSAGINFLTAHDGFTLADLTAYADKHNAANGEHDRDGTDANWSDNLGVEGDTDDDAIRTRRRRRRRALLGSLLLSRGTPMLLAGDELSHSQGGNNNAYCQDNTTGWLDWSGRGDPWRDLRDWVAALTRLRRRLPLLREDRYFDGRPLAGDASMRDIVWLDADGHELQTGDWMQVDRLALMVLLAGTRAPATGDRLLLAFNAGDHDCRMQLPASEGGWIAVLDNAATVASAAAPWYASGAQIELGADGLMALAPADTPGIGIGPGQAAEARRRGLATHYVDIAGTRRQVPPDALARLLPLLAPRPPAMAPAQPASCFRPPALASPPGRWILSAQLYALRGEHGWGIGDYGALAELVRTAAQAGATGVLCSPVHAPRSARPDHASPYAASNRLMLNPWLIDVPRAAGAEPPPAYRAFVERPATRETLARLEAADSIDYAAVIALKREALGLLHGAFRSTHLGPCPSALGEDFLRFRHRRGAALRHHAIFEALDAWFLQRDGSAVDWSEWPAALRDPDSAEVARFAREHAVEVEFAAYLQWVAWRQWQRASRRARACGMELGLVTDLALAGEAAGAETWQWGDLVAHDAELGAPPDAFAPQGQNWQLPPWRPERLQALHMAPFKQLLDAVMDGAGAIRIDHVLGLLRQFWIPRGARSDHGAYVDFPFEAMLQCLGEASRRHRCAVIGEDLGNVPDGLREQLQAAGVLGVRVVYFEREPDGQLRPPSAYPPWTAAALSTHDLPTIAALRRQADIDERERLGLYPDAQQADAARQARDDLNAALDRALEPYMEADAPDAFALALHGFLAATASRLVIVQLDDVVDMPRQANLPALGDVAPNWRQRLPSRVDSLGALARMRAVAALMAASGRQARDDDASP